jgi:hypothetical protein
MVTPSRRSRLVLVAGTLVTVMMVVYAIPALAQTGDAREDKVLAQVEEKEKPEQKRKTEEKGKLEEKGTAEQERVPRTGSILLGIAVGALLIGGGVAGAQEGQCWTSSFFRRSWLRGCGA